MAGVLCLGNPLKGDDGVGYFIYQKLARQNVFFGGDAPENVLDKLAGLRKIWIVDAGDFGGRPGEIKFACPSVLEQLSLSTHSSSLGLICRYIKKRFGLEIKLILIQPKQLEFGRGLSQEIKAAAENVCAYLADKLL